MTRRKTFFILLTICVFFYGCGDYLSEKDIKRAVYTVMRGFEASVKDDDPEVSNQYQNAADIKFTVDDGAIENEMSIMVRDDRSVELSGSVLLSDYTDSYSGYSVEGELLYVCERDAQLITVCDIECDVVLTGGKVETLQFALEMDSPQSASFASITANGKEIELNKYDNILEIIRKFSPGVNED